MFELIKSAPAGTLFGVRGVIGRLTQVSVFSGLSDWGAAGECVRANRASTGAGQPDRSLHRPHQALRLQLRHQGNSCVMELPVCLIQTHTHHTYYSKTAY